MLNYSTVAYIDMHEALKVLGITCVVAIVAWRLAARFTRLCTRHNTDKAGLGTPLLQEDAQSTHVSEGVEDVAVSQHDQHAPPQLHLSPAKLKQPADDNDGSKLSSPNAPESSFDDMRRIPAGLGLARIVPRAQSQELHGSDLQYNDRSQPFASKPAAPDSAGHNAQPTHAHHSHEDDVIAQGPQQLVPSLACVHTAPTLVSPARLSRLAIRAPSLPASDTLSPSASPNALQRAMSHSQPGSSSADGEDVELQRLGTAQALPREEGMPPLLPPAYSLSDSLPSSSQLGIKLGSRNLSGLLDAMDGTRVEQNYWSVDDEEGGPSSASNSSAASETGWGVDTLHPPPPTGQRLAGIVATESVLSSAAVSVGELADCDIVQAVEYGGDSANSQSEGRPGGPTATALGALKTHTAAGRGTATTSSNNDQTSVLANAGPHARPRLPWLENVEGCATALASPTGSAAMGLLTEAASAVPSGSPAHSAEGHSPSNLVFAQGQSPQAMPTSNPFSRDSPFLAAPVTAGLDDLQRRLPPLAPTAAFMSDSSSVHRGSGMRESGSSESPRGLWSNSIGAGAFATVGTLDGVSGSPLASSRLENSMLPARIISSSRQSSLPSSRLRNGSVGSSRGSLSSTASTGATALKRLSSGVRRSRFGVEEQPCLAIKLTVIAGPCEGLEYCSEPSTTEITIGRADSNAIMLADMEVSGQHMVMQWDADDMCWKVADLGSLNGSLLNHYTISRAYRQPGELYKLRTGDELQLGSASRMSVCYVARDMLPEDVQARPVHVPAPLPPKVPPAAAGWAATMMQQQPRSAACNGEGFKCAALGVEGAACQRVGVEHARKSQACEDLWGQLSPVPCSPVPATLLVLFDGHCGIAAAQQARDHLPRHLQQSLVAHKELLMKGASLEPMWRDVFAATDASVRTDEGCTGTAVLVWQDQHSNGVYVQAANVGDSAAILFDLDSDAADPMDTSADSGPSPPRGPQPGPVVLTCEHRPSNPVELARLQALGVQVGRDGRLYGLNLSRGFGDVCLKEQDLGMSAEPHVSSVTRLQPGQRCMLVMASDGLWDVTNKERAMQVALQSYNSSFGNMRMLAQALVEHAQKHRSKDDITVVAAAIEVPHGAAQ